MQYVAFVLFSISSVVTAYNKTNVAGLL